MCVHRVYQITSLANWFNLIYAKEHIYVHVQKKKKILKFKINQKQTYSKNTHEKTSFKYVGVCK